LTNHITGVGKHFQQGSKGTYRSMKKMVDQFAMVST